MWIIMGWVLCVLCNSFSPQHCQTRLQNLATSRCTMKRCPWGFKSSGLGGVKGSRLSHRTHQNLRLFGCFCSIDDSQLVVVFFFHPKSKYSHVGLPDITFIHLGDNGVIVFVKHLLWFHFYCWWLQIQVGRFMAIQVPRVYPAMMILAVEVILSHAI